MKDGGVRTSEQLHRRTEWGGPNRKFPPKLPRPKDERVLARQRPDAATPYLRVAMVCMNSERAGRWPARLFGSETFPVKSIRAFFARRARGNYRLLLRCY